MADCGGSFNTINNFKRKENNVFSFKTSMEFDCNENLKGK
jgi:hypothetical protein